MHSCACAVILPPTASPTTLTPMSPTTYESLILSTGKPTSQSTTGFDGASSRAVDVITDGNYGTKSCTHTNAEADPWWTVDLEATHAINKVAHLCSSLAV
jgi:hypothetical protein